MFFTLIILGSIWAFVGVTLLTYNIFDDNRRGFSSNPWILALALFWPWFLVYAIIDLVNKIRKQPDNDEFSS